MLCVSRRVLIRPTAPGTSAMPPRYCVWPLFGAASGGYQAGHSGGAPHCSALRALACVADKALCRFSLAAHRHAWIPQSLSSIIVEGQMSAHSQSLVCTDGGGWLPSCWLGRRLDRANPGQVGTLLHEQFSSGKPATYRALPCSDDGDCYF